MKKPSIKNANQLTDTLLEVFDQVREGEVELNVAHQLSSVADKICKNTKNQLIYKKLTGSSEPIPFLETK